MGAVVRKKRRRQRAAGSPSQILAPTASFTMVQLTAAYRIYQRATTSGGGQGKGQGTIQVAISAASAGTIHARCRSAADGVTIVQPEWQATTIAGGATSAGIAGVDARLGWFYLDLKGSDGAWKLGNVPIGMGRLIGLAGQSLAVCMVSRFVDGATSIAATGASINPNGRALISNETFSAANWQQFQDSANAVGVYNSAGGADLLDQQIQASGVNCGLIGNVFGSTSIDVWQPGQMRHTELARVIALAGGAFEAFWWFQGHSDGGKSYQAYLTSLTTLIADLAGRSLYAAKFYLSCIPNWRSAGTGTFNSINQRNRAAAEWCAINGGVYVPFCDLTLFDSTHPDQASTRRQAWHFHRATLPALTGGAGDDGPQVVRVVKAGVDLICTVAHSSGTALSIVGAPGSRMLVTATNDNAGTSLALDAVSPFTLDSPTQFTLKLASDPGDVALEMWPMGLHPVDDGTADMLYDNALDGLPVGRQLRCAPVPVLRKSNAGTLSGTGIGYAAGKFGTGRSAGELKSATKLLPSWPWDGQTLECWVKVTSLPGTTSMVCGQVGNLALYVTATGAIIHSCGTNLRTTPTAPIVAGQTYHLRLEQSPIGFTRWLFVNGVLTDTIAGPMAIGAATPFAIGGNGSGGGVFTTGVVDEVAWFNRQLTRGANFIPPATPYAGTEPGLVHLWHVDSSGADAV